MLKGNSFYDYAWSPVVGCLNDCWYCYAKKDMEKIGHDFKPTFYEDRLNEPLKMRIKKRIFVTHYCDLFGDWVPELWINKILDVIKRSIHDYIFLTKNPKRHYNFKFSDNCILGVTVESQAQWDRVDIIKGLNNRKICSIEPIMGDFTDRNFNQFEQIIIGKMIYYKSVFNPAWVRSVKHPNIYYKQNVKIYR